MQTIPQLIEQFSSVKHIAFEQLDNEIVLVKVDNSFATATISLYGGQVVQWQPKSQAAPVLWCSEQVQYKQGKAVRAGVPICWPWFGAHPVEKNAPSHGYARLSGWHLSSLLTTPAGETELCMTMLDSLPRGNSVGNGVTNVVAIAAGLTIKVLIGEELSIELVTTNTGIEPVTITEALHAYFFVSDIAQIKISGLNQCTYVDLLDDNMLKSQSGAIEFSEELGRVYLDTAGDCIVEDSVLNRTIRIAKTGSQSTVVWNPWLETASKMDDLGATCWTSLVCVESANALTNSVSIAPGKQHAMKVVYSLAKL